MATIRRHKNTGNWEALIYLGRDPETGKTRWRSQTFRHRTDAQEWAKKLEVQRDEGAYRPSLSKLTLTSYLRDKWLPMYRTQVRSTYTIEKVFGKWIFTPQPNTPFIGAKPLHRLVVADFDKLYAAMADSHGMQRRGIEHLHALLKRALKSAVRKGELPRNPTEFATLPKPDVRAEIKSEDDEEDAGPVQYLSKDQVVRFLAVAKQDRLSALWHLLLDAGLRPGEAFALQWRHVDLERGIVKVRGTLARLRGDYRKGGKGWVVTKPKTASSADDVPLSLATIWQLKLWQKSQKREKERLGDEWQDHGFVFTTETGTPLGNNVVVKWSRLLAAADAGQGDLVAWEPEPVKSRKRGRPAARKFTRKFPLYVLRHTCATLALLDGVDLLKVSRRLRHKNIAITARFYGHMKAEHTIEAAESFNRLAASVS